MEKGYITSYIADTGMWALKSKDYLCDGYVYYQKKKKKKKKKKNARTFLY